MESKELYISEPISEFDIQEDNRLNTIIYMHSVTQDYAENKSGFSIITLNSDNSIEKISTEDYDTEEFSNDDYSELSEIKLDNIDIHTPLVLEKTSNSLSSFGGETPSDFNIPTTQLNGSFQYLGKISSKTDEFNWLNIDLNIIAPIYFDFESLWIDYSNENNPIILNPDEIDNSETVFEEEIKPDSFISFEKTPFSATPKDQDNWEYFDGIGTSGTPLWSQGFGVPCEEFEGFKFVCQIDSSHINVDKTNIKGRDDHYQSYFKTMDFSSSSHLYIFFNPLTKVAYLTIQ
jgi:hypothetical protein